jgi:16S rRNA (adenine1518-N6/adenine1519-N6)-dimethyltransferase
MGFFEKRPHLSKLRGQPRKTLSRLRGQPRKTLSRLRGQHFLKDKAVVAKIIAAANLDSGDTVLEVGPGLGILTREIVPAIGRLVAVELDPLYAAELRKEFEAKPHTTFVEGDILKLRIGDIIAAPYKLITNLPYNITSAFLKKFLLEPPHPRLMIVMIQKEVAERICVTTNRQKPQPKADPPRAENSKPTSMLGLMCNLYAECSLVCRVSAGAFVPPPKVDSAVVKLAPYSEKDFVLKWGFEHGLAEDFLAFANRFFASPRKKMSGVLPKPLAAKLRASLSALEESPDSRPAALSLPKWVELWKIMR